MSEGTAVPYVSRWAADLLNAEANLDGVRVSYRPLRNQDFISDTGDIEAIYWADWNGQVEVRALKGTSNVKYREEATRSLIVMVAWADLADADDTLPSTSAAAKAEQRAANLVGEVVKTLQANQPTSPGTHLSSISVFIEGWEGNPGTLTRGTVDVPAIYFDIDVRIQANVEQ